MGVLVESYVASSASRAAADRLIREALDGSPVGGVRFLGSMFIPGDATAFFLFDRGEPAAIRAVMERAGITVDRLVEADADNALSWSQEV